MKSAFKKLVALIYVGLASGDLAMDQTELRKAVSDFESAFRQSLVVGPPNKINQSVRSVCTRLALVIYHLDTASNCQAAQKKSARTHLCDSFNRLQSAVPLLYQYDELSANHLLPHKALCRKIGEVYRRLDNNHDMDQLRTIFLPHINAAQEAVNLSFQHWHWCCRFCANAIRLLEEVETVFLKDLLIALNFNTPAFCKWLAEDFKTALASVSTMEEQGAFIGNEIMKYKLLPSPQLAFVPGAISVRRFMLGVCKTEWSWRVAMENKKMGSPQQQQALAPFILQTSFSVPQAALFARLLTETGIIKSGNHSALLKSLAAILSTPRKSEVSAGSLRVNFYTPDKPAKEIVKEYLFKMLNEIKSL